MIVDLSLWFALAVVFATIGYFVVLIVNDEIEESHDNAAQKRTLQQRRIAELERELFSESWDDFIENLMKPSNPVKLGIMTHNEVRRRNKNL